MDDDATTILFWPSPIDSVSLLFSCLDDTTPPNLPDFGLNVDDDDDCVSVFLLGCRQSCVLHNSTAFVLSADDTTETGSTNFDFLFLCCFEDDATFFDDLAKTGSVIGPFALIDLPFNIALEALLLLITDIGMNMDMSVVVIVACVVVVVVVFGISTVAAAVVVVVELVPSGPVDEVVAVAVVVVDSGMLIVVGDSVVGSGVGILVGCG